jgi:hypothetical protein
MSSPGHPSKSPLSQSSNDDDDKLSVDLLVPTQNSLVVSPVGRALPDFESIINPDAWIASTHPLSRPPSPLEMTALWLFGLHSRLNPSGKQVVNPYEIAKHTFLRSAKSPDADNDDGDDNGNDNGNVDGNDDGDDNGDGAGNGYGNGDGDSDGNGHSDDKDNPDNDYKVSSEGTIGDNKDDASEGTIVPGTQLLPAAAHIRTRKKDYIDGA